MSYIYTPVKIYSHGLKYKKLPVVIVPARKYSLFYNLSKLKADEILLNEVKCRDKNRLNKLYYLFEACLGCYV